MQRAVHAWGPARGSGVPLCSGARGRKVLPGLHVGSQITTAPGGGPSQQLAVRGKWRLGADLRTRKEGTAPY